jgi:hypothetical protein
LAQNNSDEESSLTGGVSDSESISSVNKQDEIDNSILVSKNDKSFQQCSSAGNIYSENELNENLQELIG